jgi:hypothetical protein
MTTEAIEAMFAGARPRPPPAALTADFADDCVVEGTVPGRTSAADVRRYTRTSSAFDYRIHL